MRSFLLRCLLVALLVGLVPRLRAADYNLGFEDASTTWVKVYAPFVAFTGGRIVQNDYYWQGVSGKQYGTYSCPWCTPCPSCVNALTMTFSELASRVTFTFVHNQSPNWFFGIVDDQGRGGVIEVGCQGDGCGGYTDPVRIQWPYDGIKKLTIVADNTNWWSYAIDDVSYSINPVLGIVARLGDNPDDPNPPTAVRVTSTSTIHIPLGRTFSVRLKQDDGLGHWLDVPSAFALSRENVTDTPSVAEETLFPGYALFLYNTRPNAATRLLQSLHLGSATLTIIPTDTTLPTVNAAIESQVPASLGPAVATNARTWDGMFTEQGSIRGIPPQYLKAIGDHETGHTYDINAWRYEPGDDANSIAALRGAAPYADYRLPTPPSDGGYAIGRFLCPAFVNAACGFAGFDDLAAATSLFYLRDDTSARIPDGLVAPPVTVQEICDGNTHQRWDCTRVDTPPPVAGPPGHPRPSRPPDPYQRTATPHEASSYGIMQSTWYSVIEEGFTGASPETGAELRRNPALLFDTQTNIARGTASLITGSNELRYKYAHFNGLTATSIPSYGTPADYAAAWRLAVTRYNGSGVLAQNYATAVMQLVPSFLGVLPASPPIVSNGCGGPPTLATADQAIIPGGQAMIAVDASDATQFQWYTGALGDTSNPIPDSNNAFVTLRPAASTSYWVQATNSCGTASAQVLVTVQAPCMQPAFSTVSNDTSVARGTVIRLSASVTGATSYQWYIIPAQGLPTQVANATESSLTVTPLATTTYAIAARNDCDAMISRFITVTVTACDLPQISVFASATSVSPHTSVTLSAQVTGATLVEWLDANGAVLDTSALTSVTPSVTSTYVAKASNACGSVLSNPVTILVTASCPRPVITEQPQSATVAAGQSVVLSVGSTDPSASYQWFSSPGVSWSPLPDAHTPSISVTAGPTTSYYAAVTNACGTINSDVAAVMGTPACIAPQILTPPQSAAGTLGTTVLLLVQASGTAGTYQWYSSGDGTTYSAVPNADGANLSVTLTGAIQYYFVRITNACGLVDSAAVTASGACTPPQVISDPSSVTITAGQSESLSISAPGTALTYQWYAAVSLGTWAPVDGATEPAFTVRPTTTTYYYVHVTGACGEANSGYAIVTVATPPPLCTAPPTILGDAAQPAMIALGASSSLSVLATGASTYQWFTSDAGAWVALAGATGATVAVQPTATTYYLVRASNDCGTTDSLPIQVNVTPACALPDIVSLTDVVKFYPGNPVTLNVVATGSNLVYQWLKSDPAGSALQPITAGTASTLVDYAQSDTVFYYVQVTNGCGNVMSYAAEALSLTACIPPSADALQPADQTITLGQSASISVVAHAQTAIHYQWYVADFPTVAWFPLPDTDTPMVTVVPTQDSWYEVVVSTDCGAITQSAAIVRVQ